MEEEKTVNGYNIPLRELTEEEATRDITLDRFNDYMCTVGEDLVDQHESIVDYKVYGGWLLARYPEKNLEILRCINDSWPSVQSMMYEVFDAEGEDNELNVFYTDFAEFLNLTGAAKERVNQILIQIDEHYNGG